ncbi:MAG TPA: mechanosensitive ion channel domain-containing protein [Sedimentisphaerales bacterium]|nr:mechanosensitive ion channel domain-containing protein [Sedimentisphaerales bacterium]
MTNGLRIARLAAGVATWLAIMGSSMALGAQAGGDAAGAAQPTGGATPAPTWDTFQAIASRVYQMLAEYGLKVLGAVLIFLIGRYVAGVLSRLLSRVLAKAKVDPTLVPFIENLGYTVMLVFVVIAALGQAGVQTTSLIAVLGAAGLAIGLALQGSLANFASGVLLLVFKPFRVGDFVEVAGVKGTVCAIRIFNTVLNSPDNIRIVVPNGQVTGGSISNYTINGTRRVDLTVSVSYGDDLQKARRVIEGVLAADSRILADPAPVVAVHEMASSSINFVVRPWVKASDYWKVYWDLTEQLKVAIDKNGLTIPFPQQDVHIKTNVAAAALKSA